MQRQITTLDFKGQNIFVGIDVHLKSWTVTILTEELTHKGEVVDNFTFLMCKNQPPPVSSS
ncbi:MAG: hypothetical protein Q7U86_01295 [Draconibacterium sp.]|nr:hypothetical protein [Draconibacterium sp.]